MKNKYFRYLFLPFYLSSIVLLLSCRDNTEPEPEEDQEVITTVTLRLNPEDTEKGQSATATWRDLDGPGGQPATIDNLVLKANTAYRGSLTFLNESAVGQAKDITAEIRDKGNEHQVFYVITPQNLLKVQTTDQDNRNRPIGLETNITTEDATGTGTVRIVLKHQPRLKSNTSTINTGETDVDIVFDTIVQD